MNYLAIFKYLAGAAALVVGLMLNGNAILNVDSSLTSTAEARVGRPATPGSVAGVARRTTRRTIARTSVYVAALPRGCSTVVVNGATLSHCGGVYYQPYGGRYVVVNVY